VLAQGGQQEPQAAPHRHQAGVGRGRLKRGRRRRRVVGLARRRERLAREAAALRERSELARRGRRPPTPEDRLARPRRGGDELRVAHRALARWHEAMRPGWETGCGPGVADEDADARWFADVRAWAADLRAHRARLARWAAEVRALRRDRGGRVS
jgi:hypothetical protein